MDQRSAESIHFEWQGSDGGCILIVWEGGEQTFIEMDRLQMASMLLGIRAAEIEGLYGKDIFPELDRKSVEVWNGVAERIKTKRKIN